MSVSALHFASTYDCLCTVLNACSHVCQRVFACPLVRSVCVENMRPTFLTSKMLAHSAVWGYMLTGRLWWTTIYNNVKLTRSSWCAARRRFNMTHPEAGFVQPSFVWVRAVCGLIKLQPFFSLPEPGRVLSCGLLPSNSPRLAGERFSRADACKYLVFQSRTVCVLLHD